MIFCPSCGKEIVKKISVCPSCKSKINEAIYDYEKQIVPDVYSDEEINNSIKPAIFAYLIPLILLSLSKKSDAGSFLLNHLNNGFYSCLCLIVGILMFNLPNIGIGIGLFFVGVHLLYSGYGIFKVIKKETLEISFLKNYQIFKTKGKKK